MTQSRARGLYVSSCEPAAESRGQNRAATHRNVCLKYLKSCGCYDLSSRIELIPGATRPVLGWLSIVLCTHTEQTSSWSRQAAPLLISWSQRQYNHPLQVHNRCRGEGCELNPGILATDRPSDENFSVSNRKTWPNVQLTDLHDQSCTLYTWMWCGWASIVNTDCRYDNQTRTQSHG